MNQVRSLESSRLLQLSPGASGDRDGGPDHQGRTGDGLPRERQILRAMIAPLSSQAGPAAGLSREQIERMVDRAACFRVTVLILGETGVGKEVLAQRIHRQSPRAAAPMVAIDCAGLCPTLIESQLFGYERGAFTGAVQDKPGLFEAADGGTVFLDEVGELPLSAQVKLLRVLETRTVQRLGSTRERALDVRFVAATNRDLDREVEEGRFRADLLFRLDGIRLVLPPLRNRPAEVATLAEVFLSEASSREGMSTPMLSPAAMRALREHHWPGNIRELRNVMDRAMVLCETDTIEPEHLLLEQSAMPLPFQHHGGDGIRGERQVEVPSSGGAGSEDRPRAPVTRESITGALSRCAGNQTRAAALLEISRRTLVDKMTLFDLPRPRKPKAVPGGTSALASPSSDRN